MKKTKIKLLVSFGILILLFLIVLSAVAFGNVKEKKETAKMDLEYNSIDNDKQNTENINIESAINESVNTYNVEENSVNTDIKNEDINSENTGIKNEDINNANANSDNLDTYIDSAEIMQMPSGTIIDSKDIDYNNLENYFIVMSIPDDVYNYINGKSYVENSNISIEDLSYIKLLHYNFNHELQIGEIIVNSKIADEIKEIFISLFNSEYEIYSMYLPDRYWTGDGTTTDTASCDANNTSGFFYRVVDGTTKLSNHAMGMAIDINPQQNPYVSYKTGQPVCIHENALMYIDRADKDHMITENDLCYKLFTAKGYSWGGAWNSIKDYQHFEK